MNRNRFSENPFPWDFFLLAFSFSWLIWLGPVLAAQGYIELPVPARLVFIIGLFGPSLAAIFLATMREGRQGLWKLLRSAVDIRISLRWLTLIFLLPAIVDGAALMLFVVIGGELPKVGFWERPILLIPLFFGMFISGPIPEEFGWRGHALNRLQSRYNALEASLILGVIWAIWHLPLFYSNVSGHEYLSFWVFIPFVCSLSILFTWVYNNTKGNLLAAILLHVTMNFCLPVFALAQMYPGGDNRALYIATAIYAGVAALVVWIYGVSQLKHLEDEEAGKLGSEQ